MKNKMLILTRIELTSSRLYLTALQPIGSNCLHEIQSSLSVSKNYLLSQPWNLPLRTAEQNYCGVNPLSPKSDQHQISPCNINAL